MEPFLTPKEMDAIEDQLFTVTSHEQYDERRPALLRAWKKLCAIHDRKKPCEGCTTPFTPSRPWAKFCSYRCAWRSRSRRRRTKT